MNIARVRAFSSGVTVAAMAVGAVLAGATPASAACASNPTTNPITIDPGPPFREPIVIQGLSEIVTVCGEVEGSPSPQVDTSPTVDVVPFGCGTPCFVVEWDGVTTSPMTVSGGAGDAFAFQRAIPGGARGEFCVNSGQPCPE